RSRPSFFASLPRASKSNGKSAPSLHASLRVLEMGSKSLRTRPPSTATSGRPYHMALPTVCWSSDPVSVPTR
ncbi:unnamed protein product, partial [Durusdinium trenchii]